MSVIYAGAYAMMPIVTVCGVGFLVLVELCQQKPKDEYWYGVFAGAAMVGIVWMCS